MNTFTWINGLIALMISGSILFADPDIDRTTARQLIRVDFDEFTRRRTDSTTFLLESANDRDRVILTLARTTSPDSSPFLTLDVKIENSLAIWVDRDTPVAILADGTPITLRRSESRPMTYFDPSKNPPSSERFWVFISPDELRKLARAETIKLRLTGSQRNIDRTFSQDRRRVVRAFVAYCVDHDPRELTPDPIRSDTPADLRAAFARFLTDLDALRLAATNHLANPTDPAAKETYTLAMVVAISSARDAGAGLDQVRAICVPIDARAKANRHRTPITPPDPIPPPSPR